MGDDGGVAAIRAELKHPGVRTEPPDDVDEDAALHRADVHEEAMFLCVAIEGVEHVLRIAGCRLGEDELADLGRSAEVLFRGEIAHPRPMKRRALV